MPHHYGQIITTINQASFDFCSSCLAECSCRSHIWIVYCHVLSHIGILTGECLDRSQSQSGDEQYSCVWVWHSATFVKYSVIDIFCAVSFDICWRVSLEALTKLSISSSLIWKSASIGTGKYCSPHSGFPFRVRCCLTRSFSRFRLEVFIRLVHADTDLDGPRMLRVVKIRELTVNRACMLLVREQTDGTV